METPIVVLNEKQVCAVTGLSRSTLRRLASRREFPPSRRLSPGRVGWVEREVTSWIEARPLSKEEVRR